MTVTFFCFDLFDRLKPILFRHPDVGDDKIEILFPNLLKGTVYRGTSSNASGFFLLFIFKPAPLTLSYLFIDFSFPSPMEEGGRVLDNRIRWNVLVTSQFLETPLQSEVGLFHSRAWDSFAIKHQRTQSGL